MRKYLGHVNKFPNVLSTLPQESVMTCCGFTLLSEQLSDHNTAIYGQTMTGSFSGILSVLFLWNKDNILLKVQP